MFGRVAPRYDLANHLLSFGIDRWWRNRVVKLVSPVLRRDGARVMDLCCGTGDLMVALSRARGQAVIGSDFCRPMLRAAAAKDRRSPLIEADALHLPLQTASLDLITVAFGFRNFANYDEGLNELRRVLRPGGLLAVLEFSTPPNQAFRAIYQFYSGRILPRIGGLISGSPEAYRYLPDSVRKFPDAGELAERMREAGFRTVRFERMTFGIVAVHLAYV